MTRCFMWSKGVRHRCQGLQNCATDHCSTAPSRNPMCARCENRKVDLLESFCQRGVSLMAGAVTRRSLTTEWSQQWQR